MFVPLDTQAIPTLPPLTQEAELYQDRRWMDLKELDHETVVMMSVYTQQTLCPEPLCLDGMVPDEDRNPVIVEVFPGIGIMKLPVKVCDACLGRGWCYVVCLN